jgi:hypothetical protein
MAARVIPFENNVLAQNVSITASDVTPEGCILQAGQNVTFTNNAGIPISIAFNPSGIFANITNLSPTAPNNTNTQTAPSSGSVNYHVTVGAVTNGPYAIQAGPGPMYVTVSGNSTSGFTCSPDPVAIPVGGTLQMNPAVSTHHYKVAWTDDDPFTVPLTTVDSTPHAENPNDGAAGYPYTLDDASIRGTGGRGGKVIVKGS